MAAPESLSPARRAVIVAVLTTNVALYAMALTVANVSLPQMQGSLSATQDEIAWVVTFNLIATACATPLSGWLAGTFGSRAVIVGGLSIFTLASFLCGTATTLNELVLYRIMQGFFGAPLVPLSQAVSFSIYPREKQGLVSSVFGVGVVLGPTLGPMIGGYLSEAYNWRWVFFMLVPCGVVSLIGVLLALPKPAPGQRPQFDWTGFLALSVTIAALQLMLDRGERNGWFESTSILISAAIAMVAFWVFLAHSLTTRRPFLDLRLLLDRNFGIGMLLVLLFGMLNFTPLTLLPSMLQTIRGYPDSIVGFLLGMRGIGTLAGFLFMIYANRFDPRLWLVVGFTLQAWSGWEMSRFDVNVTTFDVAWTSLVQGLGVGFLWVPVTQVSYRTLPAERMAEASGVFHLLRNIGSSIHISLSVALVVHSAKVNQSQLAELVTPFNRSFDSIVAALATGSPASLLSFSNEVGRQALMIGYINAFIAYTVCALLVLPLILLVRWRPVTAAAAGP
jgi:MFS transporter, DHA2 family, multidrug resistance protein